MWHRRNSPGNGQRGTGNYNRPMKPLLLALALVVVATTTTASAKIEFIENDYTRAVALAKEQNLPLFVEAWAPW